MTKGSYEGRDVMNLKFYEGLFDLIRDAQDNFGMRNYETAAYYRHGGAQI